MVGDRFYMDLALQQAWRHQLLTYPNPPVGAAVVHDGRLLSVAAHRAAGAPHAEVEALREACYALTHDPAIRNLSDPAAIHDYLRSHCRLLRGATLYVTLEPCTHHGKTPPCSSLITDLGISRVVIGTTDPNPEAAGGVEWLRQKGVEVVLGVCEQEAKDLIEPFARWQKGRFVFFKLAQTINGAIAPGSISSPASKHFMHRLRSKIDLLLIGGNTVRIDRPVLDARLAGGRAPDVAIYSKHRTFDKTIPLFGIEGRSVLVTDDLEKALEGRRFVMIEGGAGMLEATKSIVHWYLYFVAPRSTHHQNYRAELEMEYLHSRFLGGDTLIWSRNAKAE